MFGNHSAVTSTTINQPLGDTLVKISLASLSTVSALCVLYGILAILDPLDLATKVTEGQSFLVDIVAKELLRLISAGLADTNGKLVGSRALVLWTSRAW